VNHIFGTTKKLLAALADFVVVKARESIEHNGRFNLVLSGGSSPKQLYELLASGSYRDLIEWSKVYFFFGDERYVPLDHKDSNFLMAQGALFGPLRIHQNQIFEVNTALSPSEAAANYEQRIRHHFSNGVCRFDLILLGLGDNSHTASLFPHTSVLHERKALIKEIFVEEVKMYRITFTVPLINSAQTIAFLVFSESKAMAVFNILKNTLDIEKYPAQLVHPESGDVHWFMDEGAATLL